MDKRMHVSVTVGPSIIWLRHQGNRMCTAISSADERMWKKEMRLIGCQVASPVNVVLRDAQPLRSKRGGCVSPPIAAP